MKNDENNKKAGKQKPGMLPSIKKEVRGFLNSEEARISHRGVLSGSVILVTLGIIAQDAIAAHTSHSSIGAKHVNYQPHGSDIAHHNAAPGHDNWAPHTSLTPHHSDGSLSVPHVNTHSSGNYSESTTDGELHNSAADGYGKHTASTGHHNVAVINRHSNVARGTHSSQSPHNSDNTPHISASLGHTSRVPHQNHALHINQAIPGPHTSTHSSHGSHGQW